MLQRRLVVVEPGNDSYQFLTHWLKDLVTVERRTSRSTRCAADLDTLVEAKADEAFPDHGSLRRDIEVYSYSVCAQRTPREKPPTFDHIRLVSALQSIPLERSVHRDLLPRLDELFQLHHASVDAFNSAPPDQQVSMPDTLLALD